MGALDGKVAIITGGARGTGAATARRFSEEGASVVVCDIRDELGAAVADEIGDTAKYIHLDVREAEEWRMAVDDTIEQFGRADVLVNNAAILHIAAIEETPLESYERVVNADVWSDGEFAPKLVGLRDQLMVPVR